MCDDKVLELEMEFQKPVDKLLDKKLPFSPHFLTPAGMLLPKHQQPPPMYGPRGSTVPPKFIPKYENINTQPKFKPSGNRNGPPKRQFNQEPVLPPRNWDLWCESCDRDFISKDQLEVHKSEHRMCEVVGCKYTAHPSLMDRHVAQQHQSGLFEKLKNVDSPEDIAKWREERRKNYPTRANIELKQKVKEARKERGEKLDDPKGRFNRNQKKQKNRKNNKRKRGAERKDRNGKEEEQQANEEVNQGIPMFRGTRGLWDDEEEEKKVDAVIEATQDKKDNPLLKLIGMYGSDESEDEEEVEISDAVQENVEKMKEDVPVAVDDKSTEEPSCSKNEEAEGEVKGPEDHQINEPQEKESRPEDQPRDEMEKEQSQSSRKRKGNFDEGDEHSRPNQIKNKKKGIKSGLNYDALRRTRPNTMLFKLLQGEIRHERNVLLQAVRFVVENNFFDPNVQ